MCNAEAIAEQYPQSFTTTYEQGKSFFKVENVHIGETKDADSTIMGLPLTTGFYLVDELGFEYDNESFRWAFNWAGPAPQPLDYERSLFQSVTASDRVSRKRGAPWA